VGVRERQREVQLYRGQIPSPGRPTVAWREDRVRFWAAIARGVKTEDACAEARVSGPVGFRWFRHAGGVNPCLPLVISGRYLSFVEREEIALLRAQRAGVREIGRRLGRSPSTISRELRRNASTRTYRLDYKATLAQWHAERRGRRPKIAKLAGNDRLREYVQDRLSGAVHSRDGTTVLGPAAPKWQGRGKPHRGDRRWVQGWSPQQIAKRLPVDYPDDESMRISHEAIYQALFVESRGALKRELVACLRTGRALRVPRARSRQKAWAHVTPEVVISERPAEVEDRAVPGHWEGDLLIGLERSAIGTLVERTTRFTMLIHLPREDGYRHKHTVKNGPALAGYGAITMKDALASTITTLPEQLRRSLTWDRGKEMSAHAQFKIETGVPVYFADPQSPWQRGTNENTNGLLRQYFPKGTDLARWSAEEIAAVAATLNNRPRKTLDWKTPAEALNEQLLSLQQAGVATTG
jgi:transposase, IS30 family